MTATPIPRTLALALYGNLAISVIRSRPQGRQSIKTELVPPGQRERAYQLIRREVAAGRQVFVVCPVIEDSAESDTLFSDLEKRSALAEFERLRLEVFPDLRIGLVHGKLKAREKQAVMAAFRAQELDLLVATSVIEVGIDVPNATVMAIESADRFGLAALHQLRGRVGRGAHQSYCLLLSERWTPEVAQRLKALVDYEDGFSLADIDLKLRGPGQFLGTHQSGLPEFRLASVMDFALIDLAREAADEALENGLSPALQTLVEREQTHQHLE